MSHAGALSSAGKCGQMARAVSIRGFLVSPRRIFKSVVNGTPLDAEISRSMAALHPVKRSVI